MPIAKRKKDSMKLIRNVTVLTPFRRLENAQVVIEEGRIAAVEKDSLKPKPSAVDGGGNLLVPGFIDLQVNGAFGEDFTENPSCMWKVASELTRFGVTRFLPTVITSPLEVIAANINTFQAGPPQGFTGAVPLGLHVEGPYLNPTRKGAHREEFLRLPNLEEVQSFSPEQGVRLVTLAPELPGALEVVKELTARGVVVSAGHSAAALNQARDAFAAGITWGTHLFNGMPPFNHYEPGLVGALLIEPGMRFGIIPDGIHVHPTMFSMVWKISGPGRMVAVTDAMSALGMPPGKYVLGPGQDVYVDKRSARLPNGGLAGSILSHDAALRNLIRFTGCPLEEALTCLTTTPAEVMNLGKEIGKIETGYRADLVLLSSSLEVLRTFVDGEEVFCNGR
jgi:N-acetylglucosamine-6-phosphate deacetylase